MSVGQARQAVAAAVVEYVPDPQSVHTAEPVALLYFPAAQPVHGPPLGPVYPSLHVQAERSVLVTGELELLGHTTQADSTVAPVVAKYFPVAQSVQVPLPVPILYFPAAHAEHTPPSGPVDPALHVQAVTTVLALGELEVLGHTTQSDSTVAPVVAKYFPAAQSVHAAEPVTLLYFPTSHGEHTPPFGPVYPTLQVQAATAVLGLGELLLLGHAEQVVATVAPAVLEYVAVAQLVHCALPVAILYVPAAHGEHAPPSGPVDPALQVQPAAAEQPVHDAPELAGQAAHIVPNVAPAVGEYFPAAQSVQTALPVAILYLPATHREHTPPSGPVDPALQVQAVTAVLGLGELEFAGHATQVDSSVAPVVGKYFPVAQSVHAAEPLAILYLPVTHAVHAVNLLYLTITMPVPPLRPAFGDLPAPPPPPVPSKPSTFSLPPPPLPPVPPVPL